jgi:hypothetical protein
MVWSSCCLPKRSAIPRSLWKSSGNGNSAPSHRPDLIASTPSSWPLRSDTSVIPSVSSSRMSPGPQWQVRHDSDNAHYGEEAEYPSIEQSQGRGGNTFPELVAAGVSAESFGDRRPQPGDSGCLADDASPRGTYLTSAIRPILGNLSLGPETTSMSAKAISRQASENLREHLSGESTNALQTLTHATLHFSSSDIRMRRMCHRGM